MAGISKKGLVVQARDLKLFEELAVMRVVDREAAKIVAGFGSTTRANTRLLALTRAGLLRRFFLGSRKSLYALSGRGALLADVPLRGPRRKANETLVADFDLRHAFNTRLLEAGVQQEIRKALMGHSSGEEVNSIYTHVEIGLKREAIDKLERWVAAERNAAKEKAKQEREFPNV